MIALWDLKPFTKNLILYQSSVIIFVFMFFTQSDHFVAWKTCQIWITVAWKSSTYTVVTSSGKVDGKKLASDIRDYWGEKRIRRQKKRRRKIDEQTTNETSHREEECEHRGSVWHLRLEQQIANSDRKCNSARNTYTHWCITVSYRPHGTPMRSPRG